MCTVRYRYRTVKYLQYTVNRHPFIACPWRRGMLYPLLFLCFVLYISHRCVVCIMWLSCDLAVTEPWSCWRCRDWVVTSLWLSCDLAVAELWPRRDWAVTSPSRDWAVIIGPGAVTTVVTVSSRWQFFLMGFQTHPYSNGFAKMLFRLTLNRCQNISVREHYSHIPWAMI